MLTTTQKAALKADIANNADLNAQPNTSDGAYEIARLYGALAAPDFFVYRTDINAQEIFNAVTWANLTPTDAPDGTLLWQNRSLACQGKQFNVQILLQGQTSVNASRANVRAGLQDALTNVPSGVSGATVSAGWVSVRDTILPRKATRIEKLFATGGNGSTAALAATMGWEGLIGYQDVLDARNS